MSRTKLAAAVLTLIAIVLPVDRALADDPQLCEPIKAKGCPPKFAIVELPGQARSLTIARDEGFVLYHECAGAPGGMSCSGWPQETAAGRNLKYEWTFESAGSKLSHAAGNASQQFFSCTAGEQVVATLTIANGKYRATSSETYTCGKVDR